VRGRLERSLPWIVGLGAAALLALVFYYPVATVLIEAVSVAGRVTIEPIAGALTDPFYVGWLARAITEPGAFGRALLETPIDAARALGMEDEVGSLEPGKKADIVALDLDSARLRPRYMYTQRVADYASGLDVGFVMVNGEVLMEDRLFEEVPVDEILADAERAAAVTYERADAGEYLDEPENLWNATRY
jgi:hypothetical protein